MRRVSGAIRQLPFRPRASFGNVSTNSGLAVASGVQPRKSSCANRPHELCRRFLYRYRIYLVRARRCLTPVHRRCEGAWGLPGLPHVGEEYTENLLPRRDGYEDGVVMPDRQVFQEKMRKERCRHGKAWPDAACRIPSLSPKVKLAPIRLAPTALCRGQDGISAPLKLPPAMAGIGGSASFDLIGPNARRAR